MCISEFIEFSWGRLLVSTIRLPSSWDFTFFLIFKKLGSKWFSDRIWICSFLTDHAQKWLIVFPFPRGMFTTGFVPVKSSWKRNCRALLIFVSCLGTDKTLQNSNWVCVYYTGYPRAENFELRFRSLMSAVVVVGGGVVVGGSGGDVVVFGVCPRMYEKSCIWQGFKPNSVQLTMLTFVLGKKNVPHQFLFYTE